MALDYTIQMDGTLLRVRAKGKVGSLKEVNEYGLTIIKSALSFGCHRILCNETERRYKLSIIDTFESAKYFASNALKVARIAIACNPKQICDASLWESVASSRGLKVRVFLTLDEAEEWIRE